jgi:hypothetical protein
MSYVEMPAPDWDLAVEMGRRRQAHCAARTSPRMTTVEEAENVIGWAAEWSFAMFFGLPVPEFTGDTGDEGFDFRVAGVTIDTKACKARPYFLPVKNSMLVKRTAQLVVLIWCTVGARLVQLVGGMSRRRIETYPTIANCYEPRERRTSLLIPGRAIPIADLTDGTTIARWLKDRCDRERRQRPCPICGEPGCIAPHVDEVFR